MNNNTEQLLQSIGLHTNEIKVYLTNLELGPSSAITLGQKLGLTRQMIYNIIPGLLEKGLLKQVKINQKSFFQAMPPETLIDISKSTTKQLNEILPVLKSRQAEYNAIPMITIYENVMAMREWYKYFMNNAKKNDELLIWSTGEVSYWYELDADFYKKYLDCSNSIGVQTYVILPNDANSAKHKLEVGRKNTHYKTIANHWGQLSEKWVWRDQVCYLTIRENATNLIVLQSKDLSNIERFDFWNIWSS